MDRFREFVGMTSLSTRALLSGASSRNEPLPEKVEHGFRPLDERDRPALGIEQAQLRLDAQGVVDRGGEALRRDGMVDRLGRVLVRAAVDDTAPDARSRQDGG